MSNVLSEEKKQQVIALGRLGWPLRRIQRETGVRRETAAGYLREAGVEVRPPGRWGRRVPAKPANGVTPGPDLGAKPANEVTPDPGRATASRPEPEPGRSPSASACEPYRDAIELGLSRGRNAKAIWQDLVDDHGFTGGYQSVKRLVRKLRGSPWPAGLRGDRHPCWRRGPGRLRRGRARRRWPRDCDLPAGVLARPCRESSGPLAAVMQAFPFV